MSGNTQKRQLARSAQGRIQRLLRGAAHLLEKIQAARDAQQRHYQRMRESLRRTGQYAALSCVMLLHRAVLTVNFAPRKVFFEDYLGRIPGIRLGNTQLLFNQTYGLTRTISARFLSSGSVEFAPTNGYTDQFRITLVPRSKLGFTRRHLETIVSRLPNFKFVTLEFAWDFPIRSEVDAEYVEKTGLFGKSLAGNVGTNPMYSNWGTRRGHKFVRGYARPESEVYRAETELHSRFLRTHSVNGLSDFTRLVEVLVKKHVSFQRLDRQKVARRLARIGLTRTQQRNVLGQVNDKKENLGEVLKYLRRRVHLTNVRRLCVSDRIDPLVKRAAREWIAEWTRQETPEEGTK